MNTCRYCNQSIDDLDKVKTLAYWFGTEFVSHRHCQLQGEKQEAIDCQIIDADCNDCKYFVRGQRIDSVPKGQRGQCLKFNKPTVAYPHTWTGRDCFEHRRL